MTTNIENDIYSRANKPFEFIEAPLAQVSSCYRSIIFSIPNWHDYCGIRTQPSLRSTHICNTMAENVLGIHQNQRPFTPKMEERHILFDDTTQTIHDLILPAPSSLEILYDNSLSTIDLSGDTELHGFSERIGHLLQASGHQNYLLLNPPLRFLTPLTYALLLFEHRRCGDTSSERYLSLLENSKMYLLPKILPNTN